MRPGAELPDEYMPDTNRLPGCPALPSGGRGVAIRHDGSRTQRTAWLRANSVVPGCRCICARYDEPLSSEFIARTWSREAM